MISLTSGAPARATRARDGEVLRPDPVQRGEQSAQHVIATAEHQRALQRPEIRDLLDDANGRAVALGIGADRARVLGIEIAADGAGADAFGRGAERGEQRLQVRFAPLQQVQGGTARRARPETGELAEMSDQPFDRLARHRQSPLAKGPRRALRDRGRVPAAV